MHTAHIEVHIVTRTTFMPSAVVYVVLLYEKQKMHPNDNNDNDAQAAKMERQKESFEQRYATKMGKILTKLSKETDKARVQAASTKTSPFQVRSQKRW